MRYPVTFKQINVTEQIENILRNDLYIDDYKIPNLNDTSRTNTTFIFESITWYGMLIDTKVVVTECSQVFKA